MSSSFGSSSSFPILLNNPQTDLLTQISQAADAYAQQMEGLANSIYSQTSGITDQTIANYLSSAQMASDAAQNNIQRYEQVYQPLENQLIKEANTYASPTRLQTDMGSAIAGQEQGADAARIAAEKNLQSFGIDPTMGRYQDLERASRAQAAAAGVGAAQQQRQADEATGRALRSEAIQVGERYPGQAVNFLNTQLQGLSGATNAALGRANTAANLYRLPDAYMNTAMQLRPPPVGNVSSSFHTSSSGGGNSGSRSSNGGGGRGGGDGGGTYDPYQGLGPAYGANNSYGGSSASGGYGGGQPDASIFNAYGQPNVADPGVDGTPWTDSGADTSIYSGGATDPFSSDYGGYNTGGYDYGSFGDSSGSSLGSDPYSEYSSTSDIPAMDSSSGYTGWDSGSSDSSSYTDSSGSYTGDYGGGDSSYTDDSTYAGDYARGGPVPPRRPMRYAGGGPTTGGFVPSSASPSMGAQTDDIPANLNANEFVIPRDVALWKGQEFFQKLIQQSRKNAMSAPAQGKPGPAPAGRPAFSSQAFADGGTVGDDGSGEDNDNPFGSTPIPNATSNGQPGAREYFPVSPKDPVTGNVLQRGLNKLREFALGDNGYRPLTPGNQSYDIQQRNMNQYQSPSVIDNGVINPSTFAQHNAMRFGNRQGMTPQDFMYDKNGNLITGQAGDEANI